MEENQKTMKKLTIKSKKDKNFSRELPVEQANNMVRMFDYYFIEEEPIEKPKKKRETNKDSETSEE